MVIRFCEVRGIMGGTGKQCSQNQITHFQRTIFVQTYILMYSKLNAKIYKERMLDAFSNFQVQFILSQKQKKMF